VSNLPDKVLLKETLRLNWEKITGIALGLISLVIIARGYMNSRNSALCEETVVIPELPDVFEGFRLLFITDLHLRENSTRVAQILTTIDELQPDLVCLGGDYTLGGEALSSVDDLFNSLSSCPSVVGIYGNTDYRLKISREARKQWAKQISFLKNSAMPITRDGQTLWIAGVNDPHIGFDNLTLALREVPSGAPVVLLAHSPEIIRRSLDPRIRLLLCGHTHGGQICLPGGKAIYSNMSLPLKFASGRHQLEHAILYVSRGLGSSRIPLRFNCLPEITLFTLTNKGAG